MSDFRLMCSCLHLLLDHTQAGSCTDPICGCTEDDQMECHFCDQEVPLDRFERLTPKMVAVWLCDVCATSLGGGVVFYPTQSISERAILKTMSIQTNMILEAFKKMVPLFKED